MVVKGLAWALGWRSGHGGRSAEEAVIGRWRVAEGL